MPEVREHEEQVKEKKAEESKPGEEKKASQNENSQPKYTQKEIEELRTHMKNSLKEYEESIKILSSKVSKNCKDYIMLCAQKWTYIDKPIDYKTMLERTFSEIDNDKLDQTKKDKSVVTIKSFLTTLDATIDFLKYYVFRFLEDRLEIGGIYNKTYIPKNDYVSDNNYTVGYEEFCDAYNKLTDKGDAVNADNVKKSQGNFKEDDLAVIFAGIYDVYKKGKGSKENNEDDEKVSENPNSQQQSEDSQDPAPQQPPVDNQDSQNPAPQQPPKNNRDPQIEEMKKQAENILREYKESIKLLSDKVPECKDYIMSCVDKFVDNSGYNKVDDDSALKDVFKKIEGVSDEKAIGMLEDTVAALEVETQFLKGGAFRFLKEEFGIDGIYTPSYKAYRVSYNEEYKKFHDACEGLTKKSIIVNADNVKSQGNFKEDDLAVIFAGIYDVYKKGKGSKENNEDDEKVSENPNSQQQSEDSQNPQDPASEQPPVDNQDSQNPAPQQPSEDNQNPQGSDPQQPPENKQKLQNQNLNFQYIKKTITELRKHMENSLAVYKDSMKILSEKVSKSCKNYIMSNAVKLYLENFSYRNNIDYSEELKNNFRVIDDTSGKNRNEKIQAIQNVTGCLKRLDKEIDFLKFYIFRFLGDVLEIGGIYNESYRPKNADVSDDEYYNGCNVFFDIHRYLLSQNKFVTFDNAVEAGCHKNSLGTIFIGVYEASGKQLEESAYLENQRIITLTEEAKKAKDRYNKYVSLLDKAPKDCVEVIKEADIMFMTDFNRGCYFKDILSNIEEVETSKNKRSSSYSGRLNKKLNDANIMMDFVMAYCLRFLGQELGIEGVYKSSYKCATDIGKLIKYSDECETVKNLRKYGGDSEEKLKDYITQFRMKRGGVTVCTFLELCKATEKWSSLGKKSLSGSEDAGDSSDEEILKEKAKIGYDSRCKAKITYKEGDVMSLLKKFTEEVKNTKSDANKEKVINIYSRGGVENCLKELVLESDHRVKSSFFSKSNAYAKKMIKLLRVSSKISHSGKEICKSSDAKLKKNILEETKKKKIELKKFLRSTVNKSDPSEFLCKESDRMVKLFEKYLKNCKAEAKSPENKEALKAVGKWNSVLKNIKAFNKEIFKLDKSLKNLVKKYKYVDIGEGVPMFADEELNEILRGIMAETAYRLLIEFYILVDCYFSETLGYKDDPNFKDILSGN